MNSNIKHTNAPISTTTINKNKVDAPTGNIYEAISIVSKRSNQINVDMKKELLEKLENYTIEIYFYSYRKMCWN